MQILLCNANEAWKNTIYYHDQIENGFFSLEYQKGFVSSLHNAVELFLKQIMLNNNDHSVAWVRNPKDIDDAQLQLDFMKSDDLNTFFYNCKIEQLDKFFSIEFHSLRERANKLLSIEENLKGNITNALKILESLRNSETHFYINESNYLNEMNFVILHNFMIIFYNAIAKNKLFPHAMIDFHKSDIYRLHAQEKKMEFNRSELTSFSYIDALKSNDMVNQLKSTLKNHFEDEYVCCGEDNFLLAMSICLHNEEYRDSFDDLFIILELMRKYKLFEIIRTTVKTPEELGGTTYPEESFNVNY